MKKLPLLVAYLLLVNSCEKDRCVELDDEINIDKHPYTGTLRTDGYYYNQDYDAYSTSYSTFFLYRNSIVYQESTSNLDEYDKGIRSTDKNPNKYGWGMFKVYGSEIHIEAWSFRKCGLHTIVHSGTILNDTTFLIQKKYRVHHLDNYEQSNDTFIFRQTTAKPDSTNEYL